MENTRSKEQAKAAAEAFFADLLTPQPKTKKVKIATTHASNQQIWSEKATKNLIKKPAFVATARVFVVTRQHCNTCGSVHKYAGTAQYKFSTPQRRDSLSITTPTAIDLHRALDLPSEVRYDDEYTDFCASCVETCVAMDAICSAKVQPKQMELFV